MSTRDALIHAAANLLDEGGEQAVTLRAVGHSAGVSHNAPYKHFTNRDALLAAVAGTQLEMLTADFACMRRSSESPRDKLLAAIGALVALSRENASRYQLVFCAPTLARDNPELQRQSMACLSEIVALVDEAKSARVLVDAPSKSLASLLLAAMHGLVLLEAQGQLRTEKGMLTLEASMELMVSLFSQPS